jgi:hypothetical protein
LKKKSVLDDPLRQEREHRNQFDLFEDDGLVARKIAQKYFSYTFARNSGTAVLKKMQIERELRGERTQEESADDGRPAFDSSDSLIELLALTLNAPGKTKIEAVFYFDLCYNDLVVKYALPGRKDVRWDHASLEEMEISSRDVDDILAELPSRVNKCLCVDSSLNLVFKNRENKMKGAHHTGNFTSLVVAKKSKSKEVQVASKRTIIEEEESEEFVEVADKHVDWEKTKKNIVAKLRSYTLNKKVKVTAKLHRTWSSCSSNQRGHPRSSLLVDST